MLTPSYIEHLRKIDLNSALYFVAFMHYRTIFNTSIVMKCSTATVSIMLKRFCSYFPVPLFEREGRNLTPTKFAVELLEKLEETCKGIQFLMEDKN